MHGNVVSPFRVFHPHKMEENHFFKSKKKEERRALSLLSCLFA
jgi:hypothetical protein